MNKRTKKKLDKKLNLRLLETNVVPSNEPIFCKVTATKMELEDVGCDLDLTGAIVEYIKDFPDGYSEIRVKQEEYSKWFGKPTFEYYDLPKGWLDFNNL